MFKFIPREHAVFYPILGIKNVKIATFRAAALREYVNANLNVPVMKNQSVGQTGSLIQITASY